MDHKNHEQSGTDLTVSRDDALFEALEKSKKKKKKEDYPHDRQYCSGFGNRSDIRCEYPAAPGKTGICHG